MDDMTYKALMNSEIFRSYIHQEEQKIASNIKNAEEIAEENLNAINAFEDFQDRVNASEKLKDVFKNLQYLFQTNEKYASTIDPLFVESVLLLKID